MIRRNNYGPLNIILQTRTLYKQSLLLCDAETFIPWKIDNKPAVTVILVRA